MTLSCSINNDKKCVKEDFDKIICDYVTVVNKEYSCADAKKNFTYYVGQHLHHLKSPKECGDVCPASGSGWSSLTLTKIVLNHSFYNWEMLRYN